ncbi:sugar kinase [uncultured Cohaesibacter sp.]|uniref:sugar kinase n=1 Tax=uncultured Cohaesibacter sp. TaxID=1002546 RepID=UPI0029C6A303|nr:sugar kinase [uncultured Cohaesibacter sp.]
MSELIKIASIGECMIELAPVKGVEGYAAGTKFFRQAFAGDTFNTATYLVRQFSPKAEVSYITGLGADMQSQSMRQKFADEGIKVDHITLVEGKNPGLYMIENDDTGERYFQYWRNDAAAKLMFGGWSVDKIADLLGEFKLVYFSGITLAILDDTQRDNLLAALASLKGKVKVAFDPNFRPALWPDRDKCRAVFSKAASVTDFALVGCEDHAALWQETDADKIAETWCGWGAGEAIIKGGDNSCVILNGDGRTEVAPPAKLKPVDTTGAGDSFAAGYIGMRIQDKSVDESARMAHAIAAKVIMHPGGAIDKSVWSPVEEGQY